MSIEFDWLTWVTFLVTAANVITVIAMMIHASYLKRKEKAKSKRTTVRGRN